MDHDLHGPPFVYSYLDDILITSPTAEAHRDHLQVSFCLDDHGLQVHPSKCVLSATSLNFLGLHCMWTARESALWRTKYKLSETFPCRSQRKLREFLGLVNFYHRFVPSCAQTLQPLHDLLKTAPKGTTPLKCWTEAATATFQSINDALANATLLVHCQPEALTCILTDTSSSAVGAVLQQLIYNTRCPLPYFSRKLTPAQQKYSTLTANCWPFLGCQTLPLLCGRTQLVHRHGSQIPHVSPPLTVDQPLTTSSPPTGLYLPVHVRHLTSFWQCSPAYRWLLWQVPLASPLRTYPTPNKKRMLLTSLGICTSLDLRRVSVPATDITLLCDITTGTLRPQKLQRLIFEHLHGLSHPGICATQHLITSK